MDFTKNEFSAPKAVEKIKILGAVWSYQLNSTANSAHFAGFLGEWAKLAVLFRWWLQNGPQDFDFSNCPEC